MRGSPASSAWSLGLVVFLLAAGCPADHSPADAGTADASTADAALDLAPEPGPPTLQSIDPVLGDPQGGVRLTISGTNLTGATVDLDGHPCAPVAIVDEGTLRCRTPALAIGVHDVVVTTPAGSATLPAAYEAWSPLSISEARVYSSTATTPDSPPSATWLWQQTAAQSPWHPRDGAGLLWFNDRLWLLGGWDSFPVSDWAGQLTTNEVWSSSDLGKTWTAELPHDAAPPSSGPGARWSARHTAGWLTFDHLGKHYLYVVGGDLYNFASDTWRSPDGVTWERVSANAPWGGRVLQMVGALDNDLYVMGGQTDLYDPKTALADVWRSTDGGATWERLADAPWTPRAMVYGLVEHGGSLWLMGGGTYDQDGPRDYDNDVWRFDGSTWTPVTSSAPWQGRQYHNAFAYAGELWVSSGVGPDELNRHDVWHSADGVTWTQTPSAAFLPGHADGVAVTPSGVVHASGNAMNSEVHRMVPATVAPLPTWQDLAGLRPAHGTAFLVENAFADLPGVWLDGSDALLKLDQWDAQPSGRSVFWVGRADRDASPTVDSMNPAMTVVGDSLGSFRAQVGYSKDRLEYVVTDETGSWSNGHVLRGSGLNDGMPRLVGLTHALDGTVTAYVDGAAVGAPDKHTYDSAFMGWDSIGGGYGGAPAQVTLGLVVVVPSVVSAADVARLKQFARKWTDP